jgi:Lipoyl protein ligase A/B catalytic domain
MALTWRLLVTEPLDGATNMAVDEALLRARIQASGAPTVRFYGWRPATVSLGYAQPLDETVDRTRCRALGIGLVRRPTGGSAILHEPPEREVTYSVVAREGDFPGADDVLETYRVLGQDAAPAPVRPRSASAAPARTRSPSGAGSSSAVPSGASAGPSSSTAPSSWRRTPIGSARSFPMSPSPRRG